MSEWKESALEDVLESLIDYRGKTPKKTDKGIPLITAKIVKGGYIAQPDEFIAEEDYDSWMVRGFPKEGDVVLTTEAPLGEVAQLEGTKIALAQRIVCLRGKHNILNNTYLKYYFLSAKGHSALTSRETGTTVTGIKQSELRKVTITYPGFPTQCRIADILSSLDAKIENNNKINAKLEEIAQNLFKEWFVDFGPFKDGKFVESELGLIPDGWRVGTLGEICEYSKRKISTKSLNCSNYFSTENMLQNKEGATTAASIPDVEMVTGCMEYDVLVSNIRPYFKKILRVKEVSGCSADVLCFHPKASKFYSFTYCTLYEDAFFAYVMSGAKGTKMPRGDKSQIMKYNVILPEDSILGKFSSIVEPLFERIKTLKEESIQLSTLRDTLLPKLMSGEIEV